MIDIFIVGVGMINFGCYMDKSYKDLIVEVVQMVLGDVGVDKNEVGEVFFVFCVIGFLQDQYMVFGQVVLCFMGFEGIFIFNVEGVCVFVILGLYLVVQVICVGSCDVVIVVGMEKMFIYDKVKMFVVFDFVWDVIMVDLNQEYLLKMGEGIIFLEGF